MSSERVGDFEVFVVEKLRSRSPRTGEVYDYHVLDMADWVTVIAQRRDGKLVMVEQFRHGTGRMVLEFPSGMLDEGEDPATAGLRELREETGYGVDRAEVIGCTEPNSAMQRNRMYIVLATGCERSGEPEQDEGEDVHVRIIDPEDVSDLITKGVISHSLAVTAWFYYLHHNEWTRVGGFEKEIVREKKRENGG